jgi:transglutaminase-like putative cysteine protease
MTTLLKATGIVTLIFLFGVPLYALPATLTLKPGIRPGLEPLTIEQAAAQLRATGLTSEDLVEAARALVGERMAYSRRNSFDSHRRAFYRGYGYCMQHSNALVALLEELGFKAQVVQAFQNKFPDGKVTSHAWVRVTVDGQSYNIDPLFYDSDSRQLDFEVQSKITSIPWWFRTLTGWGAPSVNAHRYYVTGVDL